MYIKGKENRLPLYYRVEEDIKEKIKTCVFPEGQLIPPEAELEKIYNVSRITIRRAVDNLVHDGLLEKQQGIGTFVTKNLIKDEVYTLQGFTEKMESQGKAVSTEVLSVEIITPTELIAEALKLLPGEKVLKLSRLRNVDDFPLALFTSYIPKKLGIDSSEDFNHSLFNVFAQHNIFPYYSDRTIHAIVLDSKNAHYLKSGKGSPALQMKYVTYDQQGLPIEYAEGIYRGDGYYYKMRIFRSSCQVTE